MQQGDQEIRRDRQEDQKIKRTEPNTFRSDLLIF